MGASFTQVYAQAVLKVGAPADVSSVGGTPGAVSYTHLTLPTKA